MSWETTQAQWLGWLEEDESRPPRPRVPSDPLDAEFERRLTRTAFGTAGHSAVADDYRVELDSGELNVVLQAGAEPPNAGTGSAAFCIPPLVESVAANAAAARDVWVPEPPPEPPPSEPDNSPAPEPEELEPEELEVESETVAEPEVVELEVTAPLPTAEPTQGRHASGSAAAGEIVAERAEPTPVRERPTTPKVIVSEAARETDDPPEVEPDEYVEDQSSPPPSPPAPPSEGSLRHEPPPPPPRPGVVGDKNDLDSWCEDAFAEHYAALEGRGYVQRAEHEAAFIATIAQLSPGSSLLDVGCGGGILAALLARNGYHVTALDRAEAQLQRAAGTFRQLGVDVALVRGDMRSFALDQTFDVVTCVGTTLGYFDESANRASMRAMAAHLRPGGRLVLQVINRDYIIGRMPTRSWWQGRGCLVLDEAEMDYGANRLQVHRTMVFEDGRQFDHRISVRLYALHELAALCHDVGLRTREVSGSRHLRGRFYGATSSEIWLVAESAP